MFPSPSLPWTQKMTLEQDKIFLIMFVLLCVSGYCRFDGPSLRNPSAVIRYGRRDRLPGRGSDSLTVHYFRDLATTHVHPATTTATAAGHRAELRYSPGPGSPAAVSGQR
jgi:hypothetical protein